MLSIRSSGAPPEAELAATPAEYARLAETIASVAAGVISAAFIKAEMSDPAPYEHCLAGLRVSGAAGPLSVSVADSALAISGSAEALALLARNLPVESDLSSDYHVHIEAAGRESWVSPKSLPLVLVAVGALDA